VGLEEELLPHGLAGGTPDGIEEERRLCFVGMTRAKRQLVLARARSRRRFGQMPALTRPSRFLAEIPPEMLAVAPGSTPESWAAPPPRGRARNEDGWPDDEGAADDDWGDAVDEEPADEFAVGERVRHAKFGPGQIVRITGTTQRRRATIRFDRGGTRELALDLARLERDG